MNSFAYLHESFPDPTKTFVYREVAAMLEIGMAPAVFSLRKPTAEERVRGEELNVEVRYLPEETELRAMIEAERGTFARAQRRALSHWREIKGDSTRVFEALWLGRELRRMGITHVHAHFAGMAARTAWLVQTLWGTTFSFTGHADDIFSPEKKPIQLEMLVRDARFIATETDYSRQRLEREFSAAKGKTCRVFNGMPSAAGPPTPVVGKKPARIVSVGRLVEKKGFPDLLRACGILRDRNVEFICDIIGGGPLEGGIRQSIHDLGLEGVVLLHGAQSQRVVRAKLENARVFVLAARVEGDGGSDNLPTVIMEAMDAGLPVVSTRLAGIPEMVDPGETGTLVEPGDPVLLAKAIEAYLNDPTLAEDHGRLGRERAGEKFSVLAAVRQLAELLTRHAAVTPPPEAQAGWPPLRRPATVRWWQRLLRR